MPSYNYHLKFELYPTADPAVRSPKDNRSVWVPSEGSSIFDDLPSHPRRHATTGKTTTATSKQPGRRSQQPNPQDHSLLLPRVLDLSYPSNRHPPTTATPDPTASSSSAAGLDIDSDDDGNNSNNNSYRANNNLVRLTERQWRARSESFPGPGFAAGLGPHTAARDWRFGRVSVESFDLQAAAAAAQDTAMDAGTSSSHAKEDGAGAGVPAASLGPTFGGPGQATKARYVPLETKNTEVGWGIVHLYRESRGDGAGASFGRRTEEGTAASAAAASTSATGHDGEDGTILCIPAVPSYLSPSDFLGFVGEKWRDDVSHYRMVMTGRMNRYLVLMKFRDAWRAQEWKKEFDGRVFNSMEPEICHVTFIKSITFETPNQPGHSKAASGSHDATSFGASSSSAAVVNSLKPFPPPTPNLIELPTCPVCLERMDDTTGLMTILCQHVFHCTCLQTWKGSGCPVCRATNPSVLSSSSADKTATTTTTATAQTSAHDPDNPYARPFGHGVSNLCSVCDCADDLWICLICGNVGCGRYKGGHAKEHWKETAHSFSLELETQHVWDYAGDMWVHRLIRDKADGKVVELPGSANERRGGRNRQSGAAEDEEAADRDVVPRAKLDGIGMEYTHLLTSQLESQRVYFEEMVSKAADKAAKAAAAAEKAEATAREALGQLGALRAECRQLREETVPGLEKELARERARAGKSTELARSLGRSLQEEKRVGEGLMERIRHVNAEMEALRKRVEELAGENEELKETNRDLTMFISGQEKLRELENEGKVAAGELEDGTVSLPEEKRKAGKGKGKAKR